MYKCKQCGAPACVIDEHIHRTCKCTRKITVQPKTRWEKFLSFFGFKKYDEIPSAITTDMNSTVEGKGKVKL
jgi:hypothetical protein